MGGGMGGGAQTVLSGAASLSMPPTDAFGVGDELEKQLRALGAAAGGGGSFEEEEDSNEVSFARRASTQAREMVARPRGRRGGISLGKSAMVRGAGNSWDGAGPAIGNSAHQGYVMRAGFFRGQRSWLRDDNQASPPTSPDAGSGHSRAKHPTRRVHVEGREEVEEEDDNDEEGDDDMNSMEEEEEEMVVEPEEALAAQRLVEQERAIKGLRAEPAFANVPEKDLRAMLRNARRLRLPRYASACREGAAALQFFVLLKGKIQHLTASGVASGGQGGEVDDMSTRGVCFGMEALIESGGALRRVRTVHALVDSIVLQFSVADLPKTLPPPMVESIRAANFANYVRNELRTMPIFESIEPSVFESLAPLWQLEDHGSAGCSIFEEGDEGDKLYVLLQGRVSILRGTTVLTTLDAEPNAAELAGGGAGHPFFGEMALLDGKPRMAAVHSKTPCTLLVLHQRAFAQFMFAVPDFKRRLRRYKDLRARQSELQIAIAAERRTAKMEHAADDMDRVKRLIRAANALDGPSAGK